MTTFTLCQHTPSCWRNVLSTCSAPWITKMTSFFCCCKYQWLSTVPTTNISPESPCLLMAHYIHFSASRYVSLTMCRFWDTYPMFWLFMNPSRWKMVKPQAEWGAEVLLNELYYDLTENTSLLLLACSKPSVRWLRWSRVACWPLVPKFMGSNPT